jgi:hypothetical protein
MQVHQPGWTINFDKRNTPVKCLILESFLVPVSARISAAVKPCKSSTVWVSKTFWTAQFAVDSSVGFALQRTLDVDIFRWMNLDAVCSRWRCKRPDAMPEVYGVGKCWVYIIFFEFTQWGWQAKGLAPFTTMANITIWTLWNQSAVASFSLVASTRLMY